MTATQPFIDTDPGGTPPARVDLARGRVDSRSPSLLTRARRDPPALIGVALLLIIVAAVAAAPWIAPADPTAIEPSNALDSPSWAHPLGTDGLGRDMFSRLLHGGRSSVGAAVAASVIIALLSLVLGVSAGMLGGVVDGVIMRVVDVLQALPLLVVAMVAVGLLGGGSDRLVVTVALLTWPDNARAVRATTLAMRRTGFIDAALAQGASRTRVMTRHVGPGVASVVATLTMIELGRIVLILATLSFLGFGVKPPNPEWGAMLADARSAFFVAPKLLFLPGAAIALLVLAVNLVGDGIRDALDGRIGQFQ